MSDKYKVSDIIKAIKATKGMVYLAARQIGCAPNTIYNYAKRHPSIQKAIDEERGVFLDTTELALARAVQQGEGWAVCFALKTLGKGRGYVERKEVEHSTDPDKPMVMTVISGMSVKDLLPDE